MLHYKGSYENIKGYKEIFGRAQHLNFLRLGILYLDRDYNIYEDKLSGEEAAIVPLYGTISVKIEANYTAEIGGRDSVFSSPADLVYVPTYSKYSVKLSDKSSASKIVVCRTVSESHFSPFVIHGKDVEVIRRGKNQWNRTIRNIMVDNVDGQVDRLILGETINDPGQWSGYPPHRHAEDRSPYELPSEEVYYYELFPEEGFGIQVHYSSNFAEDRGYIVKSGDAFAIPDGYHPVVAAGGYSLYYLWCMAGSKGRKLTPFIDPRYRKVES